jgi:hypothetical protein
MEHTLRSDRPQRLRALMSRKAARSSEQVAADWEQRARDWEQDERPPPSAELHALAEAQLDAEVASCEALSTRLTALVAFTGAVLALTFTLGQNFRVAGLHGFWKVAGATTFCLAVAALLASLLRALAGVRPHERPVTSAALLGYYATESSGKKELRVDRFCQCGAALEVLADANDRSAGALRWALVLLTVAGAASAATGLIIFFS